MRAIRNIKYRRVPPSRNTGSTIVMSGRCVPPAYGSFKIAMSPGAKSIAAIAACTLIGIDPRCTGMWSPIAIARPRPSNTAHE